MQPSRRKAPRVLLSAVAASSLGVLVALSWSSAVLVTIGIAVLAVVTVASPRYTVPVGVVALSLCYAPTIWTGVYVGEIPLATRIARDALLLALGVLLLPKGGALLRRVNPAAVFAVLVVCGLLLAAGPGTFQIRVFRYFVAVPVVALIAADALLTNVGEDRAISIISRTAVFVAVVSALIGMGQLLGLGPPSYYSGYVAYNLPRSTGLLGQPDNQGFLLVLGLLVLRYSGHFDRTVSWLTTLFGLAILATFSRAAILGLVIILLLPVIEKQRRKRRRLLSRLSGILMLLAIPALFALRPGSELRNTLNDNRVERIGEVVRDLGTSGFAVGRLELLSRKPVDPGLGRASAYTTDNLYLDLLVIGGVVALSAWIVLFVTLWRRSQRSAYSTLARACLILTALYGLASSALGLFPGIFMLWITVFIAVLSPRMSKEDAIAVEPHVLVTSVQR